MDVFLKIIVVLLLFFIPFAFAGAEPWGFSVLQGGVVLCWILLLFSKKKLIFSSVFKPVLFTMGFLILITGIQVLFPKTLLDTPVLYPVTFVRLYSLDHLSLFVTYLAVVSLIPQLFISQRDIQKLMLCIVLSSLAVALCAISFPRGGYIYYFAGLRGGIGPFLNRNHASLFFVFGALGALGLMFTSQLKYSKMMSKHQKTSFYMQQFCFFLLFAGLGVGAVMTRSRGGMLSLLMGLFCYAFLCAWALPRQLKKRLKGMFITLVALILCAGWIYTHTEQINAFAHRATGVSAQTRKMMYRSSWRLLKERPVWGIGVGAMPVAITSYVEWRVSGYIERLHNDWLEILLGVGFGGAVFLVGGIWWFLRLTLLRLKKLETRKQMLFAMLLSQLFAMSVGSVVDFHFFIPANAFVFFVILGGVCSVTYAKHHVHDIKISPLLGLAIIILLCCSVYIPTQKTRAWRCSVFGRGLKTQAKLAQYEQALSYYPSPRNAVRMGNAYLNASFHGKNQQERQQLRQKAFAIASGYLEKYPRDKELSVLYMRSRPLKQTGKTAM
jgi:O-antigen ligase